MYRNENISARTKTIIFFAAFVTSSCNKWLMTDVSKYTLISAYISLHDPICIIFLIFIIPLIYPSTLVNKIALKIIYDIYPQYENVAI